MRIRDYKLVASVSFLAAMGFFAWSASILLEQPEDFEARAVSTWNPSDALSDRVDPAIGKTTEFADALARPLFRKSRRPFDPAAVAASPEIVASLAPEPPPEPPPEPVQLILKGVSLSGSKAKALIGTTDAPDGVWLELGSAIAGWTISGLDHEGVRLESGGQKTDLKLYVDK